MKTKNQVPGTNAKSTEKIAAETAAHLTAAANNIGIMIGYISALEAECKLLSEKLERFGVDVREIMKELPARRKRTNIQ